MSFKDKPLGYIWNESYCSNERIEECKEMSTRSDVFRNYKIEKNWETFMNAFVVLKFLSDQIYF